jgi:PAS domain S-box-containing protein
MLPGRLHVRALAFERMTDAVLVADDERRFVDANPAACALFNTGYDELLGRRIEELVTLPPDCDIEAKWRSFLERGSDEGEIPLRRADGSELEVEYRATANIESGRHLTVLRDVTERLTAQRAAEDRRAELSKQAEEARAILDALLTNAPIGFALIDPDLRFLIVNRHLAEINARSVDEHLGKTPMELFPELPADIILTHARKVMEMGKAVTNLELASERLNGGPAGLRTFIEHWYPVRVSGALVGIGVIVNEITQQKRAMQLRENLMAIVGHDLRNPLGAVDMAASRLLKREHATREEYSRLAERILRSTGRMQRMIEQLLDYVRVEQTGALMLARRLVDLAEIARGVADELRLTNPERNVVVEAEGPTLGKWDEDRLEQVISNLISNAIHHGRGDVAARIVGHADTVEIRVCNQGDPIPADLQASIFEPFRSGREQSKRHGLGLGLYITRQIVRAHHGEVKVQSDEKETVFSVHLPRQS